MIRLRKTPAPAAPVPLSAADMVAVTAIAERVAPCGLVRCLPTPHGRLLLTDPGAESAVAPLQALGYAVHRIAGSTEVVVTGWHPAPGTSCVAEIDARIDTLYDLRSEACVANRLTASAPPARRRAAVGGHPLGGEQW